VSAQNFFEDDLLDLIFTNLALPNVGDASGLQPSGAAGNFRISLHTAQPAETASSQLTSEAAYGSYARQSVVRTTAGWTVASGVVDNDAAITFPQASSGSETETHFGIGSDVSGAGNLFMVGALAVGLPVATGITPEFAAGDLDVSVD
jgi:hypothetical protein